MATKINFTKSFIEGIPLPEAGKRIGYQDTKVVGLYLRVTPSGIKTFSVLRRINGKLERISLGRFPEVSVEQARRKAMEIGSAIANGNNPAEVKRGKKAELTLGELFIEYIEHHAKPKDIKTVSDMQENFRRYLSPWQSLKLSSITKADVNKRHAELGKKVGAHTANRTFELLSAIWNKGIAWDLITTPNPVIGLEKFKLQSRERFIQVDELPRFFKSLGEEPNETMRDYFLISLMTGARQANVLSMRWPDVSFERAEWRIQETKNGTPQTVTLSPEALEILHIRKPEKSEEQFVFPSHRGSESGHLQNPKKAWKRLLNRAGLSNLRIHDLRRTLGSWQAMTGASLPIIGKSLNHKDSKSTSIYARMNLAPVRASVNTAVSAILEAGKVGSIIINEKSESFSPAPSSLQSTKN